MTDNPIKPKIKIRIIKFRTHVHATESMDKVLEGFKSFLPDSIDEFENSEISIEHLTSSFNTPIKALTFIIKKQPRIKAIMEHFAEKLSENDKMELGQDFEYRIDEKNKVFFRVDKNLMAMGSIRLSQTNDNVQVVIAPINKNPKADFTNVEINNYFMESNLILS